MSNKTERDSPQKGVFFCGGWTSDVQQSNTVGHRMSNNVQQLTLKFVFFFLFFPLNNIFQ